MRNGIKIQKGKNSDTRTRKFFHPFRPGDLRRKFQLGKKKYANTQPAKYMKIQILLQSNTLPCVHAWSNPVYLGATVWIYEAFIALRCLICKPPPSAAAARHATATLAAARCSIVVYVCGGVRWLGSRLRGRSALIRRSLCWELVLDEL